MPKPDEETEALQKELTSLAEKCREEQKKACDTQDFGPASNIPKSKAVTRKVLKGRSAKSENIPARRGAKRSKVDGIALSRCRSH